jgi:cell division transport system permease protein
VSYVRYELGQFAPACLGLGLILALPLLLYTAMLNAQHLSAHWHSGARISAYLYTRGNDDSERQFAARVRANPQVSRVDYVSQSHALEEFSEWSHVSADVINGLSRNPLPASLEVYHRKANPTEKEIELLRLELDAMPEVSAARADLKWLSEYYQLNALLWQILWVAAIVTLSGTAFAIAFSIRLMVINRSEEIRVTRLMGGDNAYIARPFMYIGCCYGVFSALTASLLVGACRLGLNESIGSLMDLYGSDFQLRGIGWWLSLQLLACAGLLGILGARLAVGMQLKLLDRQLRF